MGGLGLVAGHTLLRHLRSARFWVLLLLAAAPAVICLIVGRRIEAFQGTTLFLTFQAVTPLLGLILGTAVLQDEIEGRTLTYLYTSPVSRLAVFGGRLGGTFAAFAPVLGLAVLLSAFVYTEAGHELALRARPGRHPHFLAAGQVGGAVALAVAAFGVYLTLFAALRALLTRAFAVGFFLAFIFEGAVSKVPHGDIAQFSVWRHVTLLFLRGFEYVPHDFRRLLPELGDPTGGGRELATLAAIFAVALAVGLWAVREREVRLPSSVA